jgi:hypothetical protein
MKRNPEENLHQKTDVALLPCNLIDYGTFVLIRKKLEMIKQKLAERE